MGPLLPLNRLAARIRLPAEWLKAEALAGNIPCLKIGRRLLFTEAAVQEALAERAGRERVGASEVVEMACP